MITINWFNEHVVCGKYLVENKFIHIILYWEEMYTH